ncbi:ROK family transcriptional regulator [Roseivivax jejudonensis]|nr:ROK family transcriptional regulator [Roseivivax jejudonensis]
MPMVSARGSNQSGMRAHNERVVLSLVRRHGALPKADIARATGLSAQTVSVIMRGLEADGLLVKGTPVRGKVGQPSVPMSLAPDGAYFFGLKIGRRSLELMLLDFRGTIVGRQRATHRYPTPDATITFVEEGVTALTGLLPPHATDRVSGLGIAMPFRIWDWARSIGAAPDALDDWRHRDIRSELAERTGLPVFLQNDATSACGAELVFGQAPSGGEFLYFYVGTFIGGGVVLNGNVFSGVTGNAGALGSMPVPTADGRRQLIDVASLSCLETLIEKDGGDASDLWEDWRDWTVADPLLAAWVDGAAAGIAHAIAAASSIIDFPSVMIDGWMPVALRARLVEETRAALARINLAGLNPPAIVEGTVGADARTLGAASLPLSERYLVDTTALLNYG